MNKREKLLSESLRDIEPEQCNLAIISENATVYIPRLFSKVVFGSETETKLIDKNDPCMKEFLHATHYFRINKKISYEALSLIRMFLLDIIDNYDIEKFIELWNSDICRKNFMIEMWNYMFACILDVNWAITSNNLYKQIINVIHVAGIYSLPCKFTSMPSDNFLDQLIEYSLDIVRFIILKTATPKEIKSRILLYYISTKELGKTAQTMAVFIYKE